MFVPTLSTPDCLIDAGTMAAGPLAALALGVVLVLVDELLPHDATMSIAATATNARPALEMTDNR